MTSPEAADRSMRIDLEVPIEAAPERVFAALTAEIDSWWTYTFQSCSTVRMEPHAGGRFYETWDGGEITFATVTRVKPGVLLALAGPMGMDERVTGAITFTFVATALGTNLYLRHVATGELPDGVEEQYRFGWETLLGDCLKPFVEAGVVPEARLRSAP
jgi:uncharacterized protein YndB with AHSA1/START domain